jgi:hypothetical protein
LPAEVRIRRRSRAGEAACREFFGSQPADSRLQGPGRLMRKDLTEPVAEFGLAPSGTLKEDLLAALTAHATSVPRTGQWPPLAKDLETRLPRLPAFGGKDESCRRTRERGAGKIFVAGDHLGDTVGRSA